MSARNDICSRNKEEAELRSTHASQYKREVVLIAYTPEDQPYLSYIDYFKASQGGGRYKCDIHIHAFPLPSSLKDYRSVLEEFKKAYTVKELFIVAHGTREGQIKLAPDLFVDLSELELDQPGPTGSFTYGMHCYGYCHSDVQPGTRIAARQLGRNLGAASSPEMPLVYRVQVQYQDGYIGWVHTGLNPELKHLIRKD